MKNSDETTKNLVTNNLALNLNVLGVLIEGEVVGEEDNDLIITNIGMAP